jgi:hypothetical protein
MRTSGVSLSDKLDSITVLDRDGIRDEAYSRRVGISSNIDNVDESIAILCRVF